MLLFTLDQLPSWQLSGEVTLQSRCERGKMRVLIGLLVHSIVQTQDARLTTVSNLAHPQLYITIGTFPMPTPHVASLLVSSYVSAQLPTGRATGEIGLHQLHWPFYVTEPIPLHTKTNPVEQQFPLAIERVQSQTELLRWLCLKRVGKLPRHDEADE